MAGEMPSILNSYMWGASFGSLQSVIYMNQFCCVDQEELQRYQFSSPSVPEKDDLSGHMDATASTSLIAENSGAVSGKSNVTNGHGTGHNGGIFNGALPSDRARLFKKANSCGRPVREWYVWTQVRGRKIRVLTMLFWVCFK